MFKACDRTETRMSLSVTLCLCKHFGPQFFCNENIIYFNGIDTHMKFCHCFRLWNNILHCISN